MLKRKQFLHIWHKDIAIFYTKRLRYFQTKMEGEKLENMWKVGNETGKRIETTYTTYRHRRASSVNLFSPFTVVRLKTGNSRLFLRQQTDKRQISVYTLSKEFSWLRKIAWASIWFVWIPQPPCLHVSISPCLYLHISTFPESKTELMEMAFPVCWLQTEKKEMKNLFVCCKQKQKTEVCFPWPANKQ